MIPDYTDEQLALDAELSGVICEQITADPEELAYQADVARLLAIKEAQEADMISEGGPIVNAGAYATQAPLDPDNRVTPGTLQPGNPVQRTGAGSKGRRRTAKRAPTAAEIRERHRRLMSEDDDTRPYVVKARVSETARLALINEIDYSAGMMLDFLGRLMATGVSFADAEALLETLRRNPDRD